MSADGKPRFQLEGRSLELHNAQVPRGRAGTARGERAKPFRILPWRGSMALRLLSNRTRAGNPELHRFLARVGLVEPDSIGALPVELLPYSAVHRNETDPMWRHTEALLAALEREVEAAGARLDGHWTEAGHQAAATLLARALKPPRRTLDSQGRGRVLWPQLVITS